MKPFLFKYVLLIKTSCSSREIIFQLIYIILSSSSSLTLATRLGLCWFSRLFPELPSYTGCFEGDKEMSMAGEAEEQVCALGIWCISSAVCSPLPCVPHCGSPHSHNPTPDPASISPALLTWARDRPLHEGSREICTPPSIHTSSSVSHSPAYMNIHQIPGHVVSGPQ